MGVRWSVLPVALFVVHLAKGKATGWIVRATVHPQLMVSLDATTVNGKVQVSRAKAGDWDGSSRVCDSKSSKFENAGCSLYSG